MNRIGILNLSLNVVSSCISMNYFMLKIDKSVGKLVTKNKKIM